MYQIDHVTELVCPAHVGLLCKPITNPTSPLKWTENIEISRG